MFTFLVHKYTVMLYDIEKRHAENVYVFVLKSIYCYNTTYTYSLNLAKHTDKISFEKYDKYTMSCSK